MNFLLHKNMFRWGVQVAVVAFIALLAVTAHAEEEEEFSINSTLVDDIYAAPYADVDYKWFITVQYKDKHEIYFDLYGIFDAVQMYREISEELDISVEEVIDRIEFLDDPVGEEPEVETPEEEEVMEIVEEKEEEREPVYVYKTSEIDRIELIAHDDQVSDRGTTYDVFAVLDDSVRIEGSNPVTQTATDRYFYHNVAASLNNRAQLSDITESIAESKSQITESDQAIIKRQEQESIIMLLITLILEAVKDRGDEEIIQEVEALLGQIN